MPTQIFFVSMDPLVCPVLNLAVYIKMFGTHGLGSNFFDWKSTCRFAEYLEKIVRKFSFQSSKGGEAWNPQPPQGSFNLREPVWPFEGLDFPLWPLAG